MAARPFKCPVCNGAGHTWRPPWVPGDQASWPASKIESYPCKPCRGSGIVWAEGER